MAELENIEREVNLGNTFISVNVEFQNSEELFSCTYECGA